MCLSNRILVVLFVLALLLSACQPVQPPTPAPTDTPLPPTPTTAPTATPLPPTPAPQSAAPQSAAPPPGKILFIGDSSVSGGLVDQQLEKMAAFSDPPLTVDTRTSIYGGGSLQIQWDTGVALKEIQKGGWDVVVLQENSGVITEGNPEAFYEYARKFDQEIEKVDGQTFFFMDWEYPKGDWDGTDGILAAHRSIAGELDVEVAPIGMAWKRAVEARPELNLYAYDNIHANNLGNYLTLIILYATLFDQSPLDHPYRLEDFVPHPDTVPEASKETAQQMREQLFIAEEDAEFLQRIAWETIQEWQSMP